MATRQRNQSESARHELPPGYSPWGHRLETVAFYLLLLVVAMRPLIGEVYHSSLHSFDRILGVLGTLTPGVTVWFDGAIWLATILAITARGLKRQRWQWSGIEVGWCLLLIAAVISTLFTSNKRLALNAVGDWLTIGVMLMTLVNLLASRQRMILLLAVIVSSGVVSATKCYMQVAVEFNETQAEYEQNRNDFWSAQGLSLDDPRVQLYERRLAAREANGFFPHSNVQGALLSLVGFAALALAGIIQRPLGVRVFLTLLFTAFLITIWTTGSLGALAAGGLAAVLWAVLSGVKVDWQRHRAKLWTIAWMLIIIGCLAMVGYGSAGKGLPGDSLNFRWNYWLISSRVIADLPLQGTGALNFDRHYLQYKPVQFPEEIRDPHNFIISATAQGGILAGLGLIVALWAGSYFLARNWKPLEIDFDASLTRDPRYGYLRWGVALIVGYACLRFWILSSYWQAGWSGQAYVIWDVGSYGILWATVLTMLLWMLDHCELRQTSFYKLALLCGGGAFLLQNMIGFSFYYPGTLTPFAAMMALLLSRRDINLEESFSRPRARAIRVTAVILAIAFMIYILIPVARSSHYLQQARTSLGTVIPYGYIEAAKADPLDPTPWAEMAPYTANSSIDNNLHRAVEQAENAVRRDPLKIGHHHLLANLLVARYQLFGDGSDLVKAVEQAHRSAELYPQSPDEHLYLADIYTRAGLELDRQAFLQQAQWHYEYALSLDTLRPPGEIRSWPDTYRQAIYQRLSALPFKTETQTAPVP